MLSLWHQARSFHHSRDQDSIRCNGRTGRARGDDTLATLLTEAEDYAERHRIQPSLFAQTHAPESRVNSLDNTTLVGVTHCFARDALRSCAHLCRLGCLQDIYLDLARIRIIEPTSKVQTLELLEESFDVRYATHTMRRRLKELLSYQDQIEHAAIQTAREELNEAFSLVLYDVTTLYLESFKESDYQSHGFSKDHKPQQPQILIGLITTQSGSQVMHEEFEGKSFEGHTMLNILGRFRQRAGSGCEDLKLAA